MIGSAQQVADEIGISERTIRRAICDGRLDAEKVGGAYRIDVNRAREVFASLLNGNRSAVAGFDDLRGLAADLESEDVILSRYDHQGTGTTDVAITERLIEFLRAHGLEDRRDRS